MAIPASRRSPCFLVAHRPFKIAVTGFNLAGLVVGTHVLAFSPAVCRQAAYGATLIYFNMDIDGARFADGQTGRWDGRWHQSNAEVPSANGSMGFQGRPRQSGSRCGHTAR